MAGGLVAVVDHGLCNVDSIARALEECGARVEKTRDPRVVARADRIVLPGVGAFGAAMRNLAAWGLDLAIRESVARGTVPFLGICLGMQLMAKTGTEGGAVPGVDLVDADVVHLVAQGADERVPHIGWNTVTARTDHPLFNGLAPGSDFYFVHSYHLRCRDAACAIATTPYCGGFTAAVALADRPIFGVQFHPEKSQRNGFRLIRNFLAI